MNHRKTVLWLSHVVPYPPAGGVLQRSFNLLREVAKVNDVTLIAFVQPAWLVDSFGSVPEGLEKARKVLSTFCQSVQFVDLPFGTGRLGRIARLCRGFVSSKGYTGSWLDGARTLEAYARLWGDKQFDIVHVDTISLDSYRSAFNGSRILLTHHNAESHMIGRRLERAGNPFHRIYLRREFVALERIERRVVPEYDENIVCSEVDRRRLLELVPGARISVVPNGVDVDYFQPLPVPTTSRSMVFAGNMGWYPNAEAARFIVKQLWPMAKQVVSDIEMDLIGARPPREAVELAGRDPAWRTHGFVTDIRPLVARAFAYVCPISDGGGTRLKILDAMAMGKAIVAHPIACEGLDLEHGRNVLFAETPEQFVQAIALLVQEPGLQGELGGKARRLAVERYSFGILGSMLNDVYERALGLGPSRELRGHPLECARAAERRR